MIISVPAEHIRRKHSRIPTRGYTFDGWYPDTTCTVPYVNGTVLNTDTVLYGRWKAEHGNLSVAKTVAGNNGDTSKAFNFTVTLGDTGINGTFGEMTFADGVATFVLKHGESKTAVGLPAGITLYRNRGGGR